MLFGKLNAHRMVLAGSASLGVLASALAAAPALAQDAPIGTVRVGGEGETFTTLPPKDVGYRATRSLTATKTETELRDVPQAITVVTREQIEDQAIQSMSDAVRYVPGVVFAQGEGNRDTPVFRGNASTSDFYVDGVKDDVQYFRDVYNIERVEVLKGSNAMIFGRGGSGGVINRVTRMANFERTAEVRLEVGSYDHYRGAFDLGNAVGENIALRLTGLYEDTDTYRDGVWIKRWGLNPTAAFKLGESTLATLSYEHFDDERVADRGIPSLNGRPFKTGTSTFFGDPGRSPTDSTLDSVTAVLEHHFANGVILRNRTRFATQDKFYQNVFPGSIVSNGARVQISAYNNATSRDNLFNQTDLTFYADTGSIKHTLLVGAEFGRQETDNVRLTGFFGAAPGLACTPATTTTLCPLVTSPTISVPITWAPNATDANNHGVAKVAAFYVQDQIELTSQLQLVLGLRYDNFKVDFRNNRTGATFSSEDDLWSPRVGLVYKPVEALSLYASYSNTYVPRAGEQLSSLSLTNQALDPEEFKNYEIGLKWDVLPDLNVTAAIFQLDRSNVVVPDPADATRSILVDGQRTKGLELSAAGHVTDKWNVIASYAYQDGEITKAQSATVPAGASLANLPKHTFALWNRYDVTDALGVGLGIIHQTKRYASTDNLVQLPGYTRVDGAVFYDFGEKFTVQVNVENLLDENYYPNAHSNSNITPGSPRAVKVGLTARF